MVIRLNTKSQYLEGKLFPENWLTKIKLSRPVNLSDSSIERKIYEKKVLTDMYHQKLHGVSDV